MPEQLFSNITLFIAIYSVGAWSTHRRAATITRIAIIVGMFLWLSINLVISASDPSLYPGVSRAGVFSQFASITVIQVITNLLYFGGAYYFGDTAFAAARERAELVARTAELADERELSARQAVSLDRVRIARELHDVVAHHVSVMGIQAGAARRVLPGDPTGAQTSLALIEASARAAIAELHGLLTTLRDGDGDRDGAAAGAAGEAAAGATSLPPAGPDGSSTFDSDVASRSSSTRGLDQLPELIAECRAAGTPAEVNIVGTPRPVSPLVGFTLYRVAQEALTNVRKHGGESATVDVRVRYLPNGVELEVADTGHGPLGSRSTTGLGLVGMHERIAAVSGALQVGPRSRGGYLVRATIPDPARTTGSTAATLSSTSSATTMAAE